MWSQRIVNMYNRFADLHSAASEHFMLAELLGISTNSESIDSISNVILLIYASKITGQQLKASF